MKVCITAKGTTLVTLTEERFGHAPYFIVIESEKGSFEVIRNPYTDVMGDVDHKVAQLLIARGIKVLISSQIGRRSAHELLAAAGIAMYTYRDGGGVKDAFDQFTKNTLVISI
jgi:predicted Fe-Mo cluster-binding NifX family protein